MNKSQLEVVERKDLTTKIKIQWPCLVTEEFMYQKIKKEKNILQNVVQRNGKMENIE